MAKQNFGSMPLNSLLKLRDKVTAVINRRADALKKELRSLGEDYKEVGRIAIYGKKKAKDQRAGRKVAAKYRHPETGETWAGRGARPRWLAAEMKKGRKPDKFLIKRPAKKSAKRRKA
jgi:DNA-binding protein H-NS